MSKQNDTLTRRVGVWIRGRSTSGAHGLVLLKEALHYIEDHGDRTVLARMCSIPEKSTAENIRRVLEAFGLEAKRDKKQPSGWSVKPVADGWKLANFAGAMLRLESAINLKLSIAGRRIASSEFFQTEREREAAAKAAEKAAEKAAAKEAEAAAEEAAAAAGDSAPAPAPAPAEDEATIITKFLEVWKTWDEQKQVAFIAALPIADLADANAKAA